MRLANAHVHDLDAQGSDDHWGYRPVLMYGWVTGDDWSLATAGELIAEQRVRDPVQAARVFYRQRDAQIRHYLEVLPAGYRDCLLISCPTGPRTWRLLVDTGPDETYPALKARLAQLRPNRAGQRHINLFIVTHMDHDHIGGAAQLLDDKSLGLTFGDIWFNAAPRPAVRGVAEGESLAQLLGARNAVLPWNRAFAGKAVVTGGNGAFAELPSAQGVPRMTLLSPTPQRLACRAFSVN